MYIIDEYLRQARTMRELHRMQIEGLHFLSSLQRMASPELRNLNLMLDPMEVACAV